MLKEMSILRHIRYVYIEMFLMLLRDCGANLLVGGVFSIADSAVVCYANITVGHCYC